MTLRFEEDELMEARRVNRLLAATPRMPLQTAWDVAVMNGALKLSQALPPPNFRRAGVTLETRKVEALGRAADVRILRPVGPCRGVYLDIHGGAWVLGNARMDDALNVEIARDCGVAVVSIDYRVVLNNAVMAALDDCETATAWVLETMQAEFGASTLLMGGESAGSHLVASTLIRLRNRGVDLSPIAGAVMFYGCYDLCGTPSLCAAGADTLVLHGPTLASALEKPAPSPTQFRAEIPQSLSQVVLRCLEKLPASRFGSYEELRGALLPFNSTAPSPATLGLRFVAEIVDGVVLTAMNFALMALLSGAFTGTTAARFNNPQWLVYSLGGFVLVQLYWGILEGVWGASVGKALVGLRVARLNRGTPGIPRALARQLILGWTTLPFSLAAFVLPELDDPQSRTAQLWSALFLGLQAAYVLGIFCTARRRNGFAAVHDLLTGTRVTQKSAYQARTLVSQDETPVATKEAMPVLGPYHVLASLEATGDSEILLGYDTRLLRQVWIRKTKAGEPAVPPALRNISRPGRLRWLQGERNATGSWDAYEVVSGKPLPGLLTERRPWASVRNWLHDLAAELEACAKDGSTPGVLSLDRVWITADGRAKLLDFAAPGTQPKERGQTGAAPCEPRTFLNRVAMSALEGRVASAEEASGRTVSAPLALSARAFLHDLIAPSSNGTFAEKLKPLLQEAPSVAWWKRLAMVLVFVAPVVFVTLFMVLGTQLYQRWQKEQPEIVSMLNCLIAHHDLEHGNSPLAGTGLNVPEARAALEIVIAGRYRHIVHDEKAWSSPACRMAINHDQRAVAERIVAAHPHVGEDELKTAEALVQPLIGAREEKLPEMGPMMNRVAARMIGWMLEAMAVLSLVCALVFRRGPLFGILGIAVVTKGGAEASRLRMLGRGVIAWSPALLCGVMVKHLPPAGGGISSFMAFLLAALVIASLARRERGLQDLLAGTWLVPGN